MHISKYYISIHIHRISGGQKKRLSIGEMIISNARVLLLDEITNGLDRYVYFCVRVCMCGNK